MRIISWAHDAPTKIQQGPVLAGVEYLGDDHNCGGWLGGYPWGCSIRDFDPPAQSDPSMRLPDYMDDDPTRSILIVRAGGYGDLIFLTPTMREIKRRWPHCRLALSVSLQCVDLVRGFPMLDEILPYPCPMPLVDKFDHVVSVGNILEFDPRGRREHAIDLFADAFGLTLVDRQCSIHLTDDELAAARERFPRDARPRIGIQLYSTTAVRTYPAPMMMLVVAALAKINDVFCFVDPHLPVIPIPRTRCTNEVSPPLSFRESCALLATCDSFVGPDSSMTHVAGALDVPCVALYGSFDWRLRTSHAKRTLALTGPAPCAPCFHHPRLEQMPETGECMTARTQDGEPLGFCTALARIDPKRIVTKAEDMAHAARRGKGAA